MLRLLDGDGNQMAARVGTNAAHLAKRIGKGNVIRLDVFTPLSHHGKGCGGGYVEGRVVHTSRGKKRKL